MRHSTIDKDSAVPAMERRAALLAAAAQLTQASGAAGWSMATLARSAGIGKGTSYLYFPTKLDVIEALLEGEVEGWVTSCCAAIQTGHDCRRAAQLMQEAAATRPLLQALLAAPIPGQHSGHKVAITKLASHFGMLWPVRQRAAYNAAAALIAALQGAAALDPQGANTPHHLQGQTLFYVLASGVLMGLRAT